MDHKIICWGDYAIPVPLNINWIAWDSDGRVYGYTKEPRLGRESWNPVGRSIVFSGLHGLRLIPPNDDRWENQLYDVS